MVILIDWIDQKNKNEIVYLKKAQLIVLTTQNDINDLYSVFQKIPSGWLRGNDYPYFWNIVKQKGIQTAIEELAKTINKN